jgi:hypothetical protein
LACGKTNESALDVSILRGDAVYLPCLFEKKKKGTRVFFFFSGHGKRVLTGEGGSLPLGRL